MDSKVANFSELPISTFYNRVVNNKAALGSQFNMDLS